MRYIFAVLALMWAVPTAIKAQPTDSNSSDRSLQWLDRPWKIRYVLFVEDERMMKSGTKISRQWNSEMEAGRTKALYRSADALFEPRSTFATPGADPLSAFLISFDKDGRVTEPSRLITLIAKRNVLDHLLLVEANAPTARPFRFARWSQGVPGDVTFSPAVCAGSDSDRYADDWNPDLGLGNFGCREWTAQLYKREQPYIEVTTYTRNGNFIGEFVGWSRFSDPPKPVIGQHGKTWFCLHECPAGEKPGAIPNIKAWAAKHGYPVPKRAPKQPLYPNRDYDFND